MMKKLLLTFFLVLWTVFLFAAARFWVGGGSSANWNATGPTNWAATSGGAGNQSVPGASDDVTFDGAGASGNTSCTITGADAAALTLTFTTGYTATITIATSRALVVSGNITDRTQHTWTVNSTAANALQINAASTITSNGKTFPGNVTFSGSNTKTLSGDWTITGNLTVTGANTVNSGTLNIGGGLIGAGASLGTTTYNLNGTGTWSLNLGSGANGLTFNTAGTITIANATFGSGTMTYTAGTVSTGTGTLTFQASCTLNTNGISWFNVVAPSGAITVTINSLFTVTGTFTFNANASTTFAGTAGFTAANVAIDNTNSGTITLKNGVTYTITTSLNAWKTNANGALTITSDHATNTAALTLNSGATCSVVANFTRIDATGGRTINTFHGTLTTTTNIFSYTDYGGGVSSNYIYAQ